MKSFKSVFTKAACMLVLASLSNSFTISQAQMQLQFIAAKESPGNIRFVRIEGDMLVFELRLSNLPPQGSTLRISDGENITIFEKKISAETYNIRCKIVMKGDISKINFEIYGKKVFLNESFNVKFRTEEKVEVTKA